MRLRAGLALATVAVIAAAAPTAADDAGDTWRERQRVREEQGAVGADLDVLRAQDAELEAALVRLEGEVAAEEALLAQASAAAADAARRLEAAAAEVDAVVARIEAQEARLRELAVEAYVGSGTTDDMVVVLAAEDLDHAARRAAVIDVVAADFDEALAQLEDSRRRLASVRRRARAAAQEADAQEAEAERRHAAVVAARDAHATLAAEVAARIEQRLAEAASLASLDAQLGADLAAEQATLIARIRGAGGGPAVGALVDPGELTSVRGFIVHVSVADAFDAMLAAAEADGIVLGGGAYRSSDQQVALRAANCPDVWDAPPSACSPPTARPGMSMHELGLAVDFTYGGTVIASQDNPAFQWLAANAGGYGFTNLPSEPWHWSTDGN